MNNKLLVLLLLAVFRLAAQEGKAVRPLEAARCEVSVIVENQQNVSLQQCFFKMYRFTTRLSGDVRTVQIAKMESGSYMATSVDRIFKDNQKATDAFNHKIQKALNDLRTNSRNQCLLDLPEKYTLTDLAFSFEGKFALISLPVNAKCAAVSELKVQMPLREFDRLLK